MCYLKGTRIFNTLMGIITAELVVISVISFSFFFCFDSRRHEMMFRKTIEITFALQPRFNQSQKVLGDLPAYNYNHAALMIRNKGVDLFVCNARSVNTRWFLTTKHCVDTMKTSERSLNLWSLKVGMLNLGNTKHAFTSSIETVLTDETKQLALVKTNKPYWPLSRRPIEIAEDLGKNGMLVGFGWGRRSYKMVEVDQTLERALVDVEDDEKCYNQLYSLNRNLRDTEFCFRYVNSENDCFLSEGAALEVDGKVLGIVSSGEKCANKLLPIVYTKLSPFKQWILDETSEL